MWLQLNYHLTFLSPATRKIEADDEKTTGKAGTGNYYGISFFLAL